MIPQEYIITDTRTTKDFDKKSFSGYAIKDVIKIFDKSLMNCKIENSVNWALELLCSGHIEKIWEKIIAISIKNININNPKLPNFLYKRYSKYMNIRVHNINTGSNDISLRNNQTIRNLVTELCIIVCNSTKLKPINICKITTQDFNTNYISTKLCATSPSICNDKFKYGDPVELKIPINEFNYCLQTRKWELSIYWLSWVFEWEKRNTKKDKYYICGYRNIDGIDKKYHTDIVWLIWEIILKETNTLKCENTSLHIFSLFKLYKYDFKSNKKTKRVFFILYAIKYFTEIYNFKNDIIPNYHLLIQACISVNKMFLDKMPMCINDKKRYLEKQLHHSQLSSIKTKEQKKMTRDEMKRLKEIADKKIKYKITRVEQIDTLMLNK